MKKEQQYEDYVSVSKIFIYLYYALSTQGVVKEDAIQTLIDQLILYYIVRDPVKNLNAFIKLEMDPQDKQ